MAEHSPLPWTWTKAEGFCDCWPHEDTPRHETPAECSDWVYEQCANVPEAFTIDMGEFHGLSDDNAALIVAAVNCHDDLVAALEGLLDIEWTRNQRHKYTMRRERARAALAKAKGGS